MARAKAAPVDHSLDQLQSDTTVKIPIADLRLAKRNPRKGNVAVIAASLRARGQYKSITVNIGTHTGRTLEVLAGNHTLKAHRELVEKYPTEGWDMIECHLVDVDDEQCKRIILADNQTSSKGGYDNAALGDLLKQVDTGDLAGIGFSQSDLDDLTRFDEDPEDDPDADYVDIDTDEDEPAKSKGRGDPVIAYSLVFETIDDKRAWLGFLTWLKETYTDMTLPQRLVAYIATLTEENDSDD